MGLSHSARVPLTSRGRSRESWHVAPLAVVGRNETWAGVLLAPYALWLTVATALSVAYARLN